MKKICLLLFLLATYNSSQACSCFYVETFCASINPDYSDEYNVVQGKILTKYTLADQGGFQIPFMDVEVIDLHHGPTMDLDTITLIGQDGVNCATNLGVFAEGQEIIFYMWAPGVPFLPETVAEQLVHPATELDGCGDSYLFVQGEQVSGPIRPGVETVPLNSFLESLSNCLSFTTGTIEEEAFQHMQVAPNPTSEQITLFHDGLALDRAELYNALGEILIADTQLIQSSGGRYELPSSNLPAGLYTLVVYAEDRRKALRVVVQ